MKQLISGKEVVPQQELTVGDYIDEMGLTIRPVLEILYHADEESDIPVLPMKNLIFGTLAHWDQINKFFCEHNRAVRKMKAQPEQTEAASA